MPSPPNNHILKAREIRFHSPHNPLPRQTQVKIEENSTSKAAEYGRVAGRLSVRKLPRREAVMAHGGPEFCPSVPTEPHELSPLCVKHLASSRPRMMRRPFSHTRGLHQRQSEISSAAHSSQALDPYMEEISPCSNHGGNGVDSLRSDAPFGAEAVQNASFNATVLYASQGSATPLIHTGHISSVISFGLHRTLSEDSTCNCLSPSLGGDCMPLHEQFLDISDQSTAVEGAEQPLEQRSINWPRTHITKSPDCRQQFDGKTMLEEPLPAYHEILHVLVRMLNPTQHGAGRPSPRRLPTRLSALLGRSNKSASASFAADIPVTDANPQDTFAYDLVLILRALRSE